VSEERRPLPILAKVFVGMAALAVLCLGGAVAGGLHLRTARATADRKRIVETWRTLSKRAAVARYGVNRFEWTRSDVLKLFATAHDAWNQPLIYRAPGLVHKNGWDLYSVGPNAFDEGGKGDDILMGEDMAPIWSGR
jgi:hypothetical protein